MNVTLTLMADRLLTDAARYLEIIQISTQVKTFVKVVGKVSVLNMFNIKVESSSSCDITISISNRNVTSQHCKSSTRL
ncbi:hypothetical protein F2Q69_00015330 [Brassica cretica]|uniref:Uncharacterized protein n=1 Tax=Brassica cretica TaxID=69181 RepID=A0A8S9QQ30_BRACR|nr:hypothetical protein F2Q69_00015330 [Brassica cretica]